MSELFGSRAPRMARWPFVVADLVLVAVALLVYGQGEHWPLGSVVGLAAWEGWVLTVCFSLGALLSVLPFVLEYRVAARLDELARVQRGLEQIKNIEQIGRQISSATASWQAVQDDSGKAVAAARELQERMSAEAQAFQEFLQRAHDTERAHLRLEVEKLRRAEGEWLQVIVRILDHVWALYRAAVRSGKVNLVGQLSLFQHACRDAAQRVGLVPLVPSGGDSFDAQLHQPVEGSPVPEPDSTVHEALATGFRYQGQVVRKALVTLQTRDGTPTATPSEEEDRFTTQMASEFRESADTGFVQAMAEEGLPSEDAHPGTPPDEPRLERSPASEAFPAPDPSPEWSGEPSPNQDLQTSTPGSELQAGSFPFDAMEEGPTEIYRPREEEEEDEPGDDVSESGTPRESA